MSADDDELVRRAQAGDAEAFGGLVARHQQFVYHLALRAACDPREAEDIAQEAFLRAWLALPRFRQQARFRTWLYRIAVNLCYNRLPGLRRESAALEAGGEAFLDLPDESPAGTDPAHGLEAQERRAFLHRQVDALPPTQRLLVALRFQQELSYEEIAGVMGMPLGTVKVGLFRARARLRQALRDFEASET